MLISADSHVIEHPVHFNGHASLPHQKLLPGYHHNGVMIKELGLLPVDSIGCAGRDPDPINNGWDDVHQGGWHPHMRPDGLDGEVLYPSIGMTMLEHENHAMREAYCETYNRWLPTYCEGREGLAGLGLCPWTTEKNTRDTISDILDSPHLKGVILPAGLMDLPDYWQRDADWFWSLTTDCGMPVHFHSMTGEGIPIRGTIGNMSLLPLLGMMQLVGSLIWGGVFDRHPDAKVVFAEAGAGWVPYWCQMADDAYRRNKKWTHLELEHLPSHYVMKNCMFTFGDDKIAMLAPEYDSVFMWACDWPHLDAVENWTAPKGEFSPRTRWVNAAELYGIKYDKYL